MLAKKNEVSTCYLPYFKLHNLILISVVDALVLAVTKIILIEAAEYTYISDFLIELIFEYDNVWSILLQDYENVLF